MPPQSWWNPETHADRGASLRARDRIKKALRQHFEGAGFIEVECAILQRSPGNEAHLHAFATKVETACGERSPLYLHTSPEFACKKLLAAGEKRIFEFARVFRNRERGHLHADADLPVALGMRARGVADIDRRPEVVRALGPPEGSLDLRPRRGFRHGSGRHRQGRDE